MELWSKRFISSLNGLWCSAYKIQALILAHERSRAYGGLLENAKAIVFMGTPHRGAGTASWGDFFAQVLQALQMNTSRNLLSDLQKNSEALWQISQQFVERVSTLSIKTFYETHRSDYVNCLVYIDGVSLDTECSVPVLVIICSLRVAVFRFSLSIFSLYCTITTS